MSDTSKRYAGRHVVTNGPDGLPVTDGPVSVTSRASTRAAATEQEIDTVPAGSRDVIAWIGEPESAADRKTRAEEALRVERQRSDGVRKTVADAVQAAIEAAEEAEKADAGDDAGAHE